MKRFLPKSVQVPYPAKMHIVAILLFLSASLCVQGQSGIARQQPVMYSATELREDYSVLRQALESAYPSLYRFADSSNISAYLDGAFKSLDKPKTEAEFYRLVALTCARLHDEHLIPRPSEAYYAGLATTRHFFPFSLKIIGRRLYVLTKARPEDPISVGSEIISINGHSTEEILSSLLPTIPSDGYIQTFDIKHLEDYSITEEENLFDLNYPIFIEDVDSFRIGFVDTKNQSAMQVATFQGLDKRSYDRYFYSRAAMTAPLQFKYLDADVGYLRISSFLKWHRARFKQDFDALYQSIFAELRAKETGILILDLRNNEGGDSAGEHLLPYLLTRPYRHFKSAEYSYVGISPIASYATNGNDLFVDPTTVEKEANGMYALKPASLPLLNDQQPDTHAFMGKIYVLINGATGSMASVVADFLKGNERAVFVGEESGGTMEGNTSHRIARLVLPHSKIRVAVPLLKTTNAVTFVKGRGVEPDHHVAPNIEDIIHGKDTELVFVLDLIRTKMAFMRISRP